MFTHVSGIPFRSLPISTITSPAFCELVLELGGLSSRPDQQHQYWGHWERVDEWLKERSATRGDFKLIIRTGKLRDPETFQKHAKEAFPLLASGGCINFEMSPFVEEYWP